MACRYATNTCAMVLWHFPLATLGNGYSLTSTTAAPGSHVQYTKYTKSHSRGAYHSCYHQIPTNLLGHNALSKYTIHCSGLCCNCCNLINKAALLSKSILPQHYDSLLEWLKRGLADTLLEPQARSAYIHGAQYH